MPGVSRPRSGRTRASSKTYSVYCVAELEYLFISKRMYETGVPVHCGLYGYGQSSSFAQIHWYSQHEYGQKVCCYTLNNSKEDWREKKGHI